MSNHSIEFKSFQAALAVGNSKAAVAALNDGFSKPTCEQMTSIIVLAASRNLFVQYLRGTDSWLINHRLRASMRSPYPKSKGRR